MGLGNVSERRSQPPQVGVSVVILALGGAEDTAAATAESPDVTASKAAVPTATPKPTAGARSRLWLPLVRRVRQPFKGMWALPGGGLRADRSLEQAAYAALESTTDLHPRYLEQLHTFGDPARSHGGLPMVSIVYWALVGRAETKDFVENDNVRWFPEHDLPELAFDHRQIIDHALWRLRNRIEYPEVATRLVGDTFTLAQLHDVYEAIAGEPIDLANFRRKMLASKQLEATGEKRREGRHRPAAVYRYADAGSGTVAPGGTDGNMAAGDEPRWPGRAAGAVVAPVDGTDPAEVRDPSTDAIAALIPSRE
ncbi:NUDIX domain-containing protein [Bifidobacterium sp. SMB2]|uniref:NUDIX domain-containing protein n=1 Tax=Bifidobacterium saimiriisciurei TaxID=2661627 RepID=A0ABX0CIC8_9BIFI|nr:NUDIX domain-containing protein [Bifidobacterium saimiriisciurei]NEG97069.1 NUDIX domain-containing protein [Bifidobacterium sp. SMB2]NEH12155.1 NUDIX domain-containing protein [Bifidobacterium saimiriisciurei]